MSDERGRKAAIALIVLAVVLGAFTMLAFVGTVWVEGR